MRSTFIVPASAGTAEPVPATGRGPATASGTASALYYRGKTAAIIERYGPGPRVHYHIGLFGEDRLASDATAEELRAEIVAAQERMLERAAAVWDASTAFSGDLLDVGCGLGGGAIYWAQRFPVQVTALTNVAEHAEVTHRFAAAAGVADRVRPLVTDIGDLKSGRRYRVAVAVESSCYMPRPQLFQRVAAVLEPGGLFGIEDIFLARPAWRAMFDAYWKTSIGTIQQYQEAAAQAGLALEQDLDVTAGTSTFWRYSLAWAQARLADDAVSIAEKERLIRSVRWHSHFLRGWREGAFRARILRFRKRG
jgi:tocopherol O-methyltransferase